MTKILPLLLLLLTTLISAPSQAFCGFYVAKADTSLFNKASKVVLVRDGDRTVVTMANDFRGDPREFAIVVPVPTVLSRGQIHVGERAVIDHLDAYTAPRLVEYHDPDPCAVYEVEMAESMRSLSTAADAAAPMRKRKAKALGVTIEAQYTVGEYDIAILSARESDGLTTWLRSEGYRLPNGAERVLGSYIRQNLRFFIAKVNLEAQSKLGFTFLRPLQVAYESPKFMLPIRLGTLNADGPQELFVFALTRNGRVETTNYRTVKLPSDIEIPPFVKNDFGTFYRDMFSHQAERDNLRTVFLEYAWDMAWCDPCAADPLSAQELRQLGVFWVDAPGNNPRPMPQSRRRPAVQGGAQNVFVTRLHLRYTGETFPEDLRLQATGDRSNFQGRYVMHHPWQGATTCAAREYWSQVRDRQGREATALASLTGWDLASIRNRQDPRATLPAALDESEPRSWWQRLWQPGER